MIRTGLVVGVLVSLFGPFSAASACVMRPTPPVFTPRSAEVLTVTPAGLGLRVRFVARNPNCFVLTARTITARVTLAGRDLGTTRVPDGISLPSDQDIPVSVDLVVPWNHLPGIVAGVATHSSVPYHMAGTVTVALRSLHFSVPFQFDGTIPQTALLRAGFHSFMQVPHVPWTTIQLPTGVMIPRL